MYMYICKKYKGKNDKGNNYSLSFTTLWAFSMFSRYKLMMHVFFLFLPQNKQIVSLGNYFLEKIREIFIYIVY